ncbi:hypothetical protein FA13DRAFT_841023 [Coprinellus micaceus]|uniref:Secreted protein n=1 Tax=Coprinellus micaceus TaxID=71717 RepID=A0A4Y7T2V1_COPMI|nr:hypothetical protein FA13DRAFT_841023 [Coprinellus micaceus]
MRVGGTPSTKAICACVAELFVGLVAPVEGAPQLTHNAQRTMCNARSPCGVDGGRTKGRDEQPRQDERLVLGAYKRKRELRHAHAIHAAARVDPPGGLQLQPSRNASTAPGGGSHGGLSASRPKSRRCRLRCPLRCRHGANTQAWWW